ncbi:MAG: hypothetical protein AB7G11_12100 [Phycisphaerales bacterium]
MSPLIWLLAANAVGLLVLAGLLHLMPRLGALGRSLGRQCAQAPLLDVVVFVLTMGPVVSAVALWWSVPGEGAFARSALAGGSLWVNLGAALVAQGVAILVWCEVHLLAHPGVRRGARIVKSLNRAVGPVRNNLAVWWTAAAVPTFTIIRITQYVVYPPLTWIVGLPRYNNAHWVNVSRQKFSGLVGYDLIWCLYCDWMTGIWSLGSEMLRNIESFWCPIRYSSPEKCENCVREFPDIDAGWAKETTDIGEAARIIESKYPGPGGVNAWFGHPVRLTRDGVGVEPSEPSESRT